MLGHSRSRRAVSPVIATVLIIALTISAAAVVWVIVSDTLDDNFPTFVYDVSISYDYNNDGKIDVIDLQVEHIQGDSAQMKYVFNEGWEVMPGYDITLNQGDTRIIKIGTNSLSAQFEPNTEQVIGVGPEQNKFRIASIELATFTVPNPTKVIVQNGATPIVGVTVLFETAEGLPAQVPPVQTNSAGEVEVYLLPDSYIAKTTTGLRSDPFHNTNQTIVFIGAVAETINVKVLDDLGSPVSGITVYSADLQQNDLGASAITDSNGLVSFFQAAGSYLFRAEYLSTNYWSSSVNVPGSNGTTLTIELATNAELIGQLRFGGQPAGNNLLLRLYTSVNASMGRWDRTNTTSFFEFRSGVAPGLYRLRLDYQRNQYWSQIVSTSDPNLIVDLGGGKMNLLVTASGTPLPNGVLTRLFTANNVSAGRYDYLNGSGIAEYTSVPSGQYRLRIDWLGQRIFSPVFTHSSSALNTIELGGGVLNVLVTAGGSPLPNGVLTRLFNANGASAGRYDYLNSTGWAEYGAIPAGSYMLRIDWLGQRTFTSSFTHDGSPQYLDLAGGALTVTVTAGGSPLPNGVLTRLFNANGASAGRYDYLNASGVAEYGAIPGGDYKLRIDWLGQRTFTNVFTHNGSNIALDIGGGALRVQVTAGGTPLPNGVLTRLFNAGGSSAGRYDYLNATGWAEYGAIPSGNYKLRIDWLGVRTFTSVFASDGTPVVVDIGGGVLNIQVNANGVPLRNGVLTRLFNAVGSSAGRYDYLNASGIAEYGAIPSGVYKLRIDWLGLRTFTANFTNDGSTIVLDVGGGPLNIKVEIGGVGLPNGVLTRLFNVNNASAGLYDYINSTSFAEYGAIPDGQYLLRIDWMGSRYYTSLFTHNGQMSYTLSLPGIAAMSLQVTLDGGPIAQNTRVQLYYENGQSASRSEYADVNGDVTFTTVPAGNYKIKVSTFFSTSFTAANSVAVSILSAFLSNDSSQPILNLQQPKITKENRSVNINRLSDQNHRIGVLQIPGGIN